MYLKPETKINANKWVTRGMIFFNNLKELYCLYLKNDIIRNQNFMYILINQKVIKTQIKTIGFLIYRHQIK